MLKGYMLIWWNVEGVRIHLSECWRGTWQEKVWEPLLWTLNMHRSKKEYTNSLHERRRRYVRGGSREYTLDGANTCTLMKHKLVSHKHERRHHDYYNVVLWWLPSTSIYKMHEGVGVCEGPGVVWAADLPRTKLLIVSREQFIIVNKSLFLWV